MSTSDRKRRVVLDLASSCGPIQIRILNHDLVPVAEGMRKLKTELPAGVYQLEFGLGEWIETRFFTLRPGKPHRDHDLSMLFPSAFPVGSLDDWEIRQLELISDLSHNPTSQHGEDGGLLLSARQGASGAGEGPPPSLDDLALLDGDGNLVCELGAEARNETGNGWAGFHAQLAPGAYRLQWRDRMASRWSEADRIEQEQALWIEPGWITGIFLHASPSDGKPNMGGMSVHMRTVGEGFEGYAGVIEREKNLAAELVLESLRGGEPVGMAQRELLELLLGSKFNDPMLGIVGAHALLGERWTHTAGRSASNSRRHGPRWTVFDTVVRTLQEKLVPDHPDVRALRWLGKLMRERKGTKKTRTRAEPLCWPPMVYTGCVGVLGRTWDEETVVVRGSPLERLAPHLQRRGPWTAWEAFETPAEADEALLAAPRETPEAELMLQQVMKRLVKGEVARRLEVERWSPVERQVGQFIAQKMPFEKLDARSVTFNDLRATGLSRDLVASALDKLSKKL